MNTRHDLKEKGISSFLDQTINLAINLFKSKKIVSIIVEGSTDKDLLSGIFHEYIKNNSVRFVSINGKQKVLDAIDKFNKKKQASEGVFFLVDVDYDHLCNNLRVDSNLIYSFYCNFENKIFFNDMEIFLINTIALEKIIINLGADSVDFDLLRSNLEKFSREIGCLRAADNVLNLENKSILDGVDLFEFISFSYEKEWSMSFDCEKLKSRLLASSPRKLDVDDLFNKSTELLNMYNYSSWILSRGHDVTRILEDFLINNTKKYVLKEDKHGRIYATNVEVLLRMSAEKQDFLKTNVGIRISDILKKD